MNEVEKMYENCNIKPKQKGYCDWDSNCPYPHHKCNDECPYWKYEDIAKYPPFTAEKLINLVMFLINKGDFDIKKGSVDITFESFTSCIAGLINNLWQDLTDVEKKQIKEILE